MYTEKDIVDAVLRTALRMAVDFLQEAGYGKNIIDIEVDIQLDDDDCLDQIGKPRKRWDDGVS